MTPKVTFGFINCNRLHYLKSCVESLLDCTHDYPNKELIIVDNASVEEGTREYLASKATQGFKVIQNTSRDPKNEFAKALNIVTKESTGDFICPLQADMQFVVKGKWLKQYVNVYEQNLDRVGCIIFDAQRRIRNESSKFTKIGDGFLIDSRRNPICGAGDVMYSRKILDMIMPWQENNAAHEGGQDSETAMLDKVKSLLAAGQQNFSCLVPIVPPSIAIYTDARGTNARVRGNKRYGDYWAPKDGGWKYYELIPNGIMKSSQDRQQPLSIEDLAIPIGWNKPVDKLGGWLKNPIRPESAMASDYTTLSSDEQDIAVHMKPGAEYLDDWMNS